MDRKILVLGGSGFIGSYLLQSLIGHTKELIATSTHDITTFAFYNDHIKWVQLILDHHYKSQISNLLEKYQPDILVNCLVIGNKTSEKYPELANLINHQINDLLVKLVNKYDNMKFYLLSTSNVFDNLPAAPDENVEPSADLIYEITKLLGEKHMTSLGTKGSIIRITTVWGRILLPFQHTNLLEDILNGNKMTVFTNIYRTPTIVSQVAEALKDYILGKNHVPVLHLTENKLESFAYWIKLLPDRITSKLVFDEYKGSELTAVLGLTTIYPHYSEKLDLLKYFALL